MPKKKKINSFHVKDVLRGEACPHLRGEMLLNKKEKVKGPCRKASCAKVALTFRIRGEISCMRGIGEKNGEGSSAGEIGEGKQRRGGGNARLDRRPRGCPFPKNSASPKNPQTEKNVKSWKKKRTEKTEET